MCHPSTPALCEEIDPLTASKRLAENPPPLLIDCREQDEFDINQLPQAKLLPLSQWQSQLATALPDPNTAILIYCHHGMRSLQATRALRNLGYSRTQSIAGGIDRWSREIDPSIPRY